MRTLILVIIALLTVFIMPEPACSEFWIHLNGDLVEITDHGRNEDLLCNLKDDLAKYEISHEYFDYHFEDWTIDPQRRWFVFYGGPGSGRSVDHDLWVVDLETCKILRRLNLTGFNTDSNLVAYAFSPSGKYFLASIDCQIKDEDGNIIRDENDAVKYQTETYIYVLGDFSLINTIKDFGIKNKYSFFSFDGKIIYNWIYSENGPFHILEEINYTSSNIKSNKIVISELYPEYSNKRIIVPWAENGIIVIVYLSNIQTNENILMFYDIDNKRELAKIAMEGTVEIQTLYEIYQEARDYKPERLYLEDRIEYSRLEVAKKLFFSSDRKKIYVRLEGYNKNTAPVFREIDMSGTEITTSDIPVESIVPDISNGPFEVQRAGKGIVKFSIVGSAGNRGTQIVFMDLENRRELARVPDTNKEEICRLNKLYFSQPVSSEN